jgi:uncharacterized RDD family membrane protein YckC
MVTGLLTFVYFVAFEVTQGWTPGKKLLGLSVHGPAGAAKPDARQSAIRNAFTVLTIIPFVGGLLAFIAIVVIAVTINGSPTSRASTTNWPVALRSSRAEPRQITRSSRRTTASPLTDSTVSMIDHVLIV